MNDCIMKSQITNTILTTLNYIEEIFCNTGTKQIKATLLTLGPLSSTLLPSRKEGNILHVSIARMTEVSPRYAHLSEGKSHCMPQPWGSNNISTGW